jgi:hypothetical protein
MRTILTSLFIAVLFLSGTAPTAQAQSPNELVTKAQALSGRTPTSEELETLLFGNSLCYTRTYNQNDIRRCMYFYSKEKLRSVDERQGTRERRWSVKKDGRLCHDDIDENEFCYTGVRVAVEGSNTIRVTMNRAQGRKKGKPIIFTLTAGDRQK